MPRVYDDWERLVAATLDKEKLRELALASSRDTSFSSSTSSRFNSPFNFKFRSELDDKPGDSYFIKAILLADEVVRVSDNTSSFKKECSEINSQAKKVALLLREAARVSLNHELYNRPAQRVVGATGNALKKAISVVLKCRGIKRVFTTVTASSFQDISSQLECSIANISWLLRDDQYQGVPPIAADEPVLCNIWELNAILHTGSVDDRCDAVGSLLSLANESEVYRKLIVEEGGWIQPLLRLVREGTPEVQEDAVTMITLLGKEDSRMIDSTVSSVFEEIIWQDSRSKLQGIVAWAVSELVEVHLYDVPAFHEYHFIQSLGQLAIGILLEGNKVRLKGVAVSRISKSRAAGMKEDKTDDYINSMTTRALLHLARQSSDILAKSEALLCFALVLKSGPREARYNSAMALMEITAVAEQDTELRKSVFRPNLPTYKAVVDQLCGIVGVGDLDLLVPCIKAIGNLARTFKATETRMISPLVRLLDHVVPEVTKEACIALTKFACLENFLCFDHSKAIINAGGVKQLVLLVYFGEQMVQRSALILLCYIAMIVPDSEELLQAEVLTVLEWVMKQGSLMQIEDVEELLPLAKGKLELYQWRGSKGFY